MRTRERDVLESAVQAVADQATKADELVAEALDLGIGGSDPFVVHAKMLRLELLNVKSDLERELGQFVLDCPPVVRRSTGSAGSGSRRVIGRTGSLRHTTSQPSSQPVTGPEANGGVLRASRRP